MKMVRLEFTVTSHVGLTPPCKETHSNPSDHEDLIQNLMVETELYVGDRTLWSRQNLMLETEPYVGDRTLGSRQILGSRQNLRIETEP